MSRKSEMIRRDTVDLVRCSCLSCGCETWERRRLPVGETRDTYTHENLCSEKCVKLFRLWSTTRDRLSLRQFHDLFVWMMFHCNKYGFPTC